MLDDYLPCLDNKLAFTRQTKNEIGLLYSKKLGLKSMIPMIKLLVVLQLKLLVK